LLKKPGGLKTKAVGVAQTGSMKKVITILIGGGLLTAVLISIGGSYNRVIRAAKSFLGVNEIAPNQGFSSDTFRKQITEAGWWVGAPWCMFFAKLVYMQAMQGDRLSAVKKYFTGSTISTYSNVQSGLAKPFKITKKATKGAIVIWEGVKDKSKGHAGIVVDVSQNGFKTIEGNWGNTVTIKDRTYTEIVNNCVLKGFIV